MSFLWVVTTLIAAASQTARNAMQSSLTAVIGTVGATQVRFLYGLPFAILFLGLVMLVSGESAPPLNARALAFTALGAVAQIAATALMLATMRMKSFSVATAYIKMEPVLVAVAGFLILGDALTPLKLLAIVIATGGVVMTSLKPGAGAALLTELRPAALGIVSAAFFGLSAIFIRGAILALPSGGAAIKATTILVCSLAMQTAMLVAYLATFDRPALTKSFTVWRQSLVAGFLGAFASQFWFLGFSLTTAANVRTLALVEVILAQIVSRRFMSQKVAGRELAGMALIVLGVAVLLWAQS
ncbi:MAG: multidrug DMT transporter permease [Rhizobiales bacterium 65-9]|nr:DMT family transporter [Hyphomicrobiales bacterium]OJY36411.1 MAG: multidrug DMT transporter permease [Rhizobiales bacterium 65-9]